MSQVAKRAEGVVEQVGGSLKEGVGKLIGNEQMEVEGKATKLKGKAKEVAAKAAERTKGKIEEVVGTVKGHVGDLIDNEQMQLEGEAKKLTGEARQKANR